MRALVRRPGPRLAEGVVSHPTRQRVNVGRALTQWDNYLRALWAAGWHTIQVAPADDCPDAVFIEDAVVVYGDLAVLARPGLESRRGEVGAVETALRQEGYRIARIEAPGTLDGGDVLKHDGVVWVGVSTRTNAEGIAQLAAHLAPYTTDVRTVPVTRTLHLKSAVTALPNGVVVGYPPLVEETESFPRFLPVVEPAGAHIVLLGAHRLLMAASAPATAFALAERGYDVTTVDISEFEKLDGCVTCLSVRLRG
jgi:dimethylargininase